MVFFGIPLGFAACLKLKGEERLNIQFKLNEDQVAALKRFLDSEENLALAPEGMWIMHSSVCGRASQRAIRAIELVDDQEDPEWEGQRIVEVLVILRWQVESSGWSGDKRGIGYHFPQRHLAELFKAIGVLPELDQFVPVK